MQNEISILFLGDVIGKPGRKAVEAFVRSFSADFKVVNGENIAGGIGVTPQLALEILSFGVDIITTGNHVWKKKEMIPFLYEEQRVLRPLNYPPGTPGMGYGTVRKNGKSLSVVNIEGRIFMNHIECPFRNMEELLEGGSVTPPVLVDFHAEATSEKVAMGWFLDGRVSAVVGTHTHIQTADEKILPKGTGYLTDVGMTGPVDSIIGMEKAGVLEKFVTQLPRKFEVGKNDVEVQGAFIRIDCTTMRCIEIKRIKEKVF